MPVVSKPGETEFNRPPQFEGVFPAAHPGVAYLLYAAWRRSRSAGTPSHGATLALFAAAVLPDLIDQPLYHYQLLGVPSTRTLGHSLLFVVPVTVVALVGARRSSLANDVGIAFAVGLLSHPATDAVFPFLLGRFDEIGFLLWPLTHSPPYVGNKPLFGVADITVTTRWVDLVVLATALALWWRDGRPGLEPIVDRVR